MRKLYTFSACLIFLSIQSIGQQITIAGTSNFQTSNAYGPFNTDAGDNSNRHAYIYSASLLSSMPSGASITTIGFERGGTSTSVVDAGASLKIYLANTTTADFGTADLTWSSAIASATLVYDGDPSSIIGNAAGWKDFVLSVPFIYSGNNIAVYVEYVQTGLSAAINWVYNAKGGQPAYSDNQTKYGNSSTLTPPVTLTLEEDRHPNLQISYTVAACTDPATAGQAISNAPAGACPNAPVSLNLNGNSTGTGTLFKWQKSATQFGIYTDISSESSNSALVVNPTATTWYKAIVKCGASGTPQNSTPVQVAVQPILPTGTYTINNTLATGGTNFQTFADAINSMKCGITGNVIFDVSAGQTFNESPEITISGSSSSTIMFRKAGAGANPKISKAGTSGTADYLLKLTGADYITFDGIDFVQTGTSSADFVEYGIFIVNATETNGSQHNTFKNGTVTLDYISSSAKGVFFDAVATPTAVSGANSFNSFLNMKIQNSFAGYYLTGNSTTYPDEGNVISTEGGGSSQIMNMGNGTTSGTVYGVYGTHQSNLLISNTDYSNFLGAGTSTIYGNYFLTSAANQIQFFNNHLHDFTGGGTVYGFYLTSGSSLTFYNNEINNLRSNTATSSTVRGVDLSGSAGFTASIYNNRFYNISSAGLTTTTVAAIETGTGDSYEVFNNMISDLRAPGSISTTGGVKGISIATATSGSVIKLYYNSVYLNDVATAAAYSSSAVYNSSSTPVLDVRNNLFVNKSDVSAGTRAVAYWKNNTIINQDINTNNNLYYAGTPGAKNLIYYDGTNSLQTLEEYKVLTGLAPRDENAVTEDVALLPITTGIIRIDPNSVSLAESGGKEIGGLTVDFEGTLRGPYPLLGQVNGGGIKPDIGADEYDGRTTDIAGPVIDFVILANTSSTVNRTLTVSITDASRIETGVNGPRLYYRKSGSATYVFDENPTINGTNYTFTFNYAAIGGVVATDVIEYYVAAQDQNGYTSTSPFGGSGNTPPGTTPPTTPFTYRILYNFSGVYTVGASGSYINLTAIATELNSGNFEVVGNTVFELQGDYDGTTGETFPIQFNQFLTSNPDWTVTIRPAAGVTARTTSGDPGTSSPLVNLNGVDRIIFDGRPGGSGTTGEWTFRNTRTATTIGSVFRFINEATNDTLQYLKLETEATLTTQGVVFFSTAASGVSGNSYNMIANNRISGRTDGTPTTMSNGIYSSGTADAPNSNNRISNNHIINFNNYGIYLSATGNGNDWVIQGNHLYGDIATTATRYGIYQNSESSINTQILNNYIGGSAPNATGMMTVNGNVIIAGINIAEGRATITGNTVANMTNANAGTSARVRGINISSTLPGTATAISNNTVFNLSSGGAGVGIAFGNQVAAGIMIAPSGAFVNYSVNQNTIYNISIENTTALTTTNIAAGIAVYNLQNATVANNRIYDIKNKTTGSTPNQPPVAAGIFNSFVTGTAIVNNMISLGNTETTNTQFIGIMHLGRGTGNVYNYYYNTVHVSGTAGGDFSSYGFARGVDTTTEQQQVANLKNNIFYVTRTGGGSANYPIANRGLIPGGGWTADYNNLYNVDNTKIGFWNSTGYDLTGWQNASAHEANSKSIQVEFVNPPDADLHLTGASVGNVMLGGIPIAGVTVDYDLQARNTIRPYMGADEGAIGLPVHLVYFKGVRQNNVHVLGWKGQCTGNDNSFTVERSANGRDFAPIGEVNASKTECDLPLGLTDRSPLPGFNYYRLKIKDENGRITYSIIIAILNKESGFEVVSVYPTLTRGRLFINVSSVRNLNLNLAISDMQGRVVQRFVKAVPQGSGLFGLDVENLSGGSYMLQCETAEGYRKTIQFVKQ